MRILLGPSETASFLTRLARGDDGPPDSSPDVGGLLIRLGLAAAALLAIVRLAL